MALASRALPMATAARVLLVAVKARGVTGGRFEDGHQGKKKGTFLLSCLP